MQYEIEKSAISLNDDDLNFIDTKVKLSLSRLNNLITKFTIQFKAGPANQDSLVTCTVKIETSKNTQFVITDTAKDLETAFSLVIGRIKRSIERNLKRTNNTRSSSSINI